MTTTRNRSNIFVEAQTAQFHDKLLSANTNTPDMRRTHYCSVNANTTVPQVGMRLSTILVPRKASIL